MTKQEVFELITQNPTCFLATIEDGAPRVRAVMALRADDRGVLFNTGTAKDLNKQIEACPDVEMAFYATAQMTQIRVRGRLELQTDEETRALVLEKLPFLAQVVSAHGPEVLRPYLLRGGRATVWTMKENFKPKEWVEL
jgi:pyridoxamine 5'-phosphate oxidase